MAMTASPTPDDSEMTPEQLAESRRYGRLKLACDLVELGVDVAFLVVVAFVFAGPLDDWLVRFGGLQTTWSRLAVFFLLLFGLLQTLVSFPLDFYSAFVLEHRFQLSRQSFGRWLGRYALQRGLALGFGLVLIEGLYGLIWLTGPHWWLAAAGASFVLSVLLGQLVPVLILPLFYKVEPLESTDLLDRFRRLAEGTSLTIQGVFRMSLSRETVKANAMLAGLGRTRRVILGDTLLDGFSADEIEVILAHEIGHHVFGHISKIIAASLVASLGTFWLCDRVLAYASGGSVDYAALPVRVLAWFTLTTTVVTLLLTPLRNAVSRHWERQCDRYALERTRRPDAYRAAFQKLAKLNKSDPDPPWLEVVLFHDHPPIGERLAMANEPVAAGSSS